jgi:hypothetical protein
MMQNRKGRQETSDEKTERKRGRKRRQARQPLLVFADVSKTVALIDFA